MVAKPVSAAASSFVGELVYYPEMSISLYLLWYTTIDTGRRFNDKTDFFDYRSISAGRYVYD